MKYLIFSFFLMVSFSNNAQARSCQDKFEVCTDICFMVQGDLGGPVAPCIAGCFIAKAICDSNQSNSVNDVFKIKTKDSKICTDTIASSNITYTTDIKLKK
ncbi:hypothetical protein [Pleionea sediminis]|uniref:hypothetical protein n=1 Tax=Pleionea sediminis TaxID=2569479 RepID=UPI0011869849|nr:hypothetical protein [Pleionea sediminis]